MKRRRGVGITGGEQPDITSQNEAWSEEERTGARRQPRGASAASRVALWLVKTSPVTTRTMMNMNHGAPK